MGISYLREYRGQVPGLRNPHLWIIIVLFAFLTICHFTQLPSQIPFLRGISIPTVLELSRHSLERLLYLLLVLYAGWTLGILGSAALWLSSAVAMLLRTFLISPNFKDALLESVASLAIGVLVITLMAAYHHNKRQQEKLEKAMKDVESARQDYEELLTNASDAIFIHDVEGNITLANKACEKLTGYSVSELTGKNVLEFLTPEALSIARQVKDKLLRGEDIEQPYEQCLITKDGTQEILRLATNLVIGDGKSIRFQHIVRDVTEQKRAEEMLTRIIDGSPVPTFAINKQHKITHWNTALESLTGVKKEDELKTDRQWIVFYREKRPVMADLIVDKASASEIEVHYRDKGRPSCLIDGAYEAEDFFPDLGEDGKWLYFTASPIRDENEEIVGAIETIQDITEAKRMQDNLRYYLKQITMAQEEERKRLARELHDDASQQILLLTHGVDNLASKAERYSPQELRNELGKLYELSQQTYQGIKRYAQALRPRILDDLGLLPAIKWLAEEIHNFAGIEIQVKTDTIPPLPPETQLVFFRIVQEALNNIHRHSRASKASVTVECQGNEVSITISDNGKGFELPRQLSDFAGQGKLGLTGMAERTRLIGGELEVGSQIGKGTTIIVKAPTKLYNQGDS
jgi:PAS domain S-box-containing protein